MRNMDVYLVMLVILGAMVVFFFFVLKSVVNQLKHMTKNNLLRQNAIYDEIIQNKTDELRQIQQELNQQRDKGTNPKKPLERLQAPQKVMPFMSKAEYVSGEVFSQYVKIKKNFDFDVTTSLKQLNLKIEADPSRYESALGLISRLTVDRVYELTTLSAIQQYNILYECFSASERKLLNEYKSTKQFDTILFVEWLKNIAFIENTEIIVRTNHEALQLSQDVAKQVVTQYDPDICEGFYVIHRGVLYDYAIKIKEMIQ